MVSAGLKGHGKLLTGVSWIFIEIGDGESLANAENKTYNKARGWNAGKKQEKRIWI